jgi:dihydrofolate reductase
MSGPGQVVWHTMMSLDGFIAGPEHSMEWMAGVSVAPGTVDESADSTGAILAGRQWHDAFAGKPEAAPYGGRFQGPIFVLTHHPEDAAAHEGITMLSSGIAEAVQTALDAANGRNLVLFGGNIGRQCVRQGLVDELRVHVAPVLLGDGVRLYEAPGAEPVRLARIHDGDPARAADLRFRLA